MSRRRLGEILIDQGLITEAQLQQAIDAQKSEGGQVGETLLRLGFISEEDLAAALGKQLLIPYASLASGLLTPQQGTEDFRKIIPYEFAREHILLPLSRTINSLSVAMFNPFWS